jgi:hypothetical protein
LLGGIVRGAAAQHKQDRSGLTPVGQSAKQKAAEVDQAPAQNRLDRVLSYSGGGVANWRYNAPERQEVRLSPQAVDPKRMRSLSRGLERTTRTRWIEYFALIMAVIFGVLCGLALINFLAGHNSETQVESVE